MSDSMQRRRPKPGSILAVILTSYMMIAIDISIVNIALPAIRVNLGFSPVTLSWVVDAYMLAYGGLLFLGGRAGDVLGRRRTLVAGIVLFTAASALGGLATVGWWLLAARALQGIGAALIAPSTMALLMASFPEGEERNRALSIYATAISFGIVIGLLLGGMLTGLLSWRWVLFVNVPVGVGLVFAIPRLLPETEASGGKLNIFSGVSVTLAIGSLVFALIHGASSGFSSTGTLLAAALLVVSAAGLIASERRARHPLVPTTLFANRNRIAAYVGLLSLLAGNFGMFFFATQFLQGVLRLSPVQTGLAYLPMAGIMIAAARIVPRLLRRYSPRTLLLIATPLQVLSMLWLSRLTLSSGYLDGILGPMILCGIATGLSNISLTSLALAQVDRREAGAASGLTQTMISIGGSLGLALLVTAFGIATRGPGVESLGAATLFVHGATLAFLVAAGLASLGFVSALVLIRTPARKPIAAPVPTAGEHKAIVRRYLEMLSEGRHADAREMLHPNWVDHTLEEVTDRASAEGLQIVVDRMIGEGDHVAVHGTLQEGGGGSAIRSRIMWFIRMEENKLAELWSIHAPGEPAT